MSGYRDKNFQIDRTPEGLLEFLCQQAELVAKREITLDEAKQQVNTGKQINNVLRLQLDIEKFKYSQKGEK